MKNFPIQKLLAKKINAFIKYLKKTTYKTKPSD